jgi:hypothetical protein
VRGQYDEEEKEKKITLNRADVDASIHGTGSASPDELQYIIDQGTDLKLTTGERNQVGVDLSIVVARGAPRQRMT